MAKKIFGMILALMMLLSLAACGQAGEASAAELSATEPGVHGKTLIVYFSWSSSGNTEKMTNTIRERTGGDLLKIEPATAYPTDHSECGDVAKAERDGNARPEIANLPDSLDEYDTIFIGYPIWWHTAPMIIGMFLESYDLSGKEIYPFSQSASMDTEQFANSMDFVRTSAKNAAVHDGLFAEASDTDGILSYLTENGFAE
ncbi:MAG: flavodoxin [Candidatus Limiplasma sp.]|nr:flavodoxin [Candidatus Limiplasma sp.]MDY4063029.1 flavodoxin [Candidatus Limiplasma sp.]